MDARAIRLRWASQERIRTDLLKAAHAVLLTELPRESVLEFWARHPLTVFKGALPPRAFFRYLWEGHGQVPPAYFWRVMEDLDTFLAGKGQCAERFFQLLNHGPGGGPPLDPGWIPRHPPPKIGSDPQDPRGWLLALLPSIVERWFPGCRMETIGPGPEPAEDGSGARWRLFLFQPIAGTRNLAVPDFRLFPGKLLAGLPRSFAYGPFDRLEVLADMRGPGACLGWAVDDAWNWKGDVLRYGAKRMGRLETLAEAMASWPEPMLSRDALGRFLDCPVVRMLRDFAPPGSKHARLRSGCAYGAPAFLVRIGFAASRRWSRWAALLHKSPPPPAPRRAWEMTETLHREMLAALGPEAMP